MLAFFVKFTDGRFGTIFADSECDVWLRPDVARCIILGGS